jgi:hypothetical protein
MALRELILRIVSKVDTQAIERLKKTVDVTAQAARGLAAGLSDVNTGGLDQAAQAAGKLEGEATAAQGAVDGIGDAATATGAKVSAAAGPAFAPWAVKANAAGKAVTGAMSAAPGRWASVAKAGAERLAGPINEAAKRIRRNVDGSFDGVSDKARRAADGASRGLDRIGRTARDVRFAVAPMLDPIQAAARRTLDTIQRWSTGVTSAVSKTADRVRAAAARRPSGGGGGGGGDGGAQRAPGVLAGAVASTIGNVAASAIVSGTKALVDFGRQALATASEVKGLSDATGANKQAIQTWIAIAKDTGVPTEAIKGSLKGLAMQVNAANDGNKDAVKLFADLGVAVQDADGKTRPMGTLLREVAGRLGDIEDPAKRATLAQKALTEQGLLLLPAFAGGSKGVDEMVAKFQKLGATMSDETVDKMDAVNHKIDDLKLVFSQIGPVVLTAFAPLIETIVDTVMPLLPALVQSIEPFIQAIAAGLKPVVEAVFPLLGTLIQQVVPIIGELTPVIAEVIQALAAGLVPVVAQLAPVVVRLLRAFLPLVPVLVDALLPVIIALVPAITQLAIALVPLIEQLIPILTDVLTAAAAAITYVANLLGELLPSVIPVVTGALGILFKQVEIVVAAFKLLWAVFTGDGDAVAKAKATLSSAFEGWWSAITEFGDRILNFFTGIWDTIAGRFGAVIDGAKNLLSSIGIGDGASPDAAVSKLARATESSQRVPGVRAGTAPSAPGSTHNTTTNKQEITLNDQRQTTVKVEANSTPAQIGRDTAGAIDILNRNDRLTQRANLVGAS